MAKSVEFDIRCPKCGDFSWLPSSKLRRDNNLTLTCSKCGHVHLAMNAVQLAVHNLLKAKGLAVGDPPAPQPIEPIRVFPSPDGKTEVVLRRNKTTGETMYTRKIKPKPRG